MQVLIFATLTALLFSGAAQAAATPAKKEKEKLTWIRWDDPPLFIYNDRFKGQGTLEVVERELETAMPQYTHSHLEATIPRVLAEAEAKSQICNAGWLDTPEFEKYFYFSKPLMVIPANGILLKEANLKDLLGIKKPYRLQTFLDKKPKWILGVGRLYGAGLDEALEKNNYKKNPQIEVVSSSLMVHRMLHADRVQYTLGYPPEAEYYNAIINDPKSKVVYVPVSDNAEFVDVVAACPKTPWGAKVIADINKALNNKELLEKISKGMDRWLSPKDQEALAPQRKLFYEKNYPNLLN